MSRGPGRAQRVIAEAFRSAPSQTFTVEQLILRVYPGVNRAEKKHRVAVLRAADAICWPMGWARWRSNQQSNLIVYFNMLDLRSYATGLIQFRHGPLVCIPDWIEDEAELARRAIVAQAIVDEGKVLIGHLADVARDMPLWPRQVEIYQAYAANDDAKALALVAAFYRTWEGRRAWPQLAWFLGFQPQMPEAA